MYKAKSTQNIITKRKKNKPSASKLKERKLKTKIAITYILV